MKLLLNLPFRRLFFCLVKPTLLGQVVAVLLLAGLFPSGQAFDQVDGSKELKVGVREIYQPPYLVMPQGQDPNVKKGRYLYFAERDRILMDFDTGERFPLAEGVEYFAQQKVLRNDGWYSVPMLLQDGNLLGLWACDWPCDGSKEKSLNPRYLAVTTSKGLRILLRRDTLLFRFKDRVLELGMNPPDQSWYRFETLRAETNEGHVLWEMVYMGLTEGYNEGRYEHYGRKAPITNYSLSVTVYPGLDWIFVSMGSPEGQRFNHVVARVDLLTGNLLVPHPNVRSISRRDMERVLRDVFEPLERDKKFVAALAEREESNPEHPSWVAYGDEAELAYGRIFGAIGKKYFYRGRKK